MPTKGLHDLANPIAGARRHQKMHVVGHEHIGVKLQVKALAAFAERLQIAGVILRTAKDDVTVVAALDDVLWVGGI